MPVGDVNAASQIIARSSAGRERSRDCAGEDEQRGPRIFRCVLGERVWRLVIRGELQLRCWAAIRAE